MGRNPEKQKMIKALEEAESESLFGDMDMGEVVDPYEGFKIHKSNLLWRLMVIHPDFTLVHPGSIVTCARPDSKESYPEGRVTDSGRIHVSMKNEEVNSLSSFSDLVRPAYIRKSGDKAGQKASSDGWERVWIVLDGGGTVKCQDALAQNYEVFGYTTEQLGDQTFLYNEMTKHGWNAALEGISKPLPPKKAKAQK